MANIVILEDDVDFSGLLATTLESEGHSTAEFTTVAQALEYFNTHSVDLLIIDLFIKDEAGKSLEGGISLIARIRQIMGSDVPMIAMSGSFSSPAKLSLKTSSRTVGATVTLPKPFPPDELFGVVDMLLERHRDKLNTRPSADRDPSSS